MVGLVDKEDKLWPVVHGLRSDCDLLSTPCLRIELQRDPDARAAIIEECERLAHLVKRIDAAVKEIEKQVAEGRLWFEEGCR